jgi:hypothetical protein
MPYRTSVRAPIASQLALQNHIMRNELPHGSGFMDKLDETKRGDRSVSIMIFA